VYRVTSADLVAGPRVIVVVPVTMKSGNLPRLASVPAGGPGRPTRVDQIEVVEADSVDDTVAAVSPPALM